MYSSFKVRGFLFSYELEDLVKNTFAPGCPEIPRNPTKINMVVSILSKILNFLQVLTVTSRNGAVCHTKTYFLKWLFYENLWLEVLKR